MKPLRNIAGDNFYYEINREERNVAAILYHFLLDDKNLRKFLGKVDLKLENESNDLEVYFEYAFIRDLWKKLDVDRTVSEANKLKFQLITEFLRSYLSSASLPATAESTEEIKAFNLNFCTTRAASEKFIVSPSNWNISVLHERFKDNNEDFLSLCKFKWCFNAKPDIVIHTSKKSAICIEAKWDSAEGTYPASGIEKQIFKARGIPYVGQLNIQKMVMKDILGFQNVEYLFLVKDKPKFDNKIHSNDPNLYSDTKLITWKLAFDLFKDNLKSNFLQNFRNVIIAKCKDDDSNNYLKLIQNPKP